MEAIYKSGLQLQERDDTPGEDVVNVVSVTLQAETTGVVLRQDRSQLAG